MNDLVTHRRRWVAAAVALLVSGVVASTVSGPASQAASSALDPTFGVGGVAVVDRGARETAFGMTVQPDGKIIGVGSTTLGGTVDALVFRLSANGTLDPGFGYLQLAVPGGGNEAAYAAAVQPDGKIVVVGKTSTGDDAVVWRLRPTGVLDSDFGGGTGLVTIDHGTTEDAVDVAIDPDGRIVVAGNSSGNGGDATVHRLTPNGMPDMFFGFGGALGYGDGNSDEATSLAVQPDGKILLTGSIGAATKLTVRRLRLDGHLDDAPDGGFGSGDGITDGITEVPLTNDFGTDLALQPDGKILVAGSGFSFGSGGNGVVARLTATGAVDASFGGPAGVHIDRGGNEFVRSISVLPGGGVVGLLHTAAPDGGDYLVKLDAGGQLDQSFGAGGMVLVPGLVHGSAVAALADGKIVVAGDDGKTPVSAVLYRFLGDFRAIPPPPPPPPAPTCTGKPATLVGTAGNDRLVGTRKGDVIVALGGNDVVKGLGGDDVVCGGDGKDTVLGGPGKDLLLGEKGPDRLVGGTGKDKLRGGPDHDSLTQ